MALEGFSIKELQSDISDSDAEWEAGTTKFTEMSSAERGSYLGYTPGPDEPSLDERERISLANLEAFQAISGTFGYPGS